MILSPVLLNSFVSLSVIVESILSYLHADSAGVIIHVSENRSVVWSWRTNEDFLYLP